MKILREIMQRSASMRSFNEDIYQRTRQSHYETHQPGIAQGQGQPQMYQHHVPQGPPGPPHIQQVRKKRVI